MIESIDFFFRCHQNDGDVDMCFITLHATTLDRDAIRLLVLSIGGAMTCLCAGKFYLRALGCKSSQLASQWARCETLMGRDAAGTRTCRLHFTLLVQR